MAKPEWGNKLACRHCGAKFYDMQRDPPVCPRCSTVYKPERPGRPERAAAEKARAVPVPAKVADPDVDIEADAEEIADDEEEELIEDTDDLEGEDDVTSVVETIDDEEER